MEIMVSVIMITYNHEKYIEEAVKGVLMQKCDFDFELIIANDDSTDRSDTVIKHILSEHPQSSKIKYIKRNQNVGMAGNFIDALKQSKGKYIALCEGDDYWTDIMKLQKQVDFLEKNNDYSMVCHDALVIDEVKGISYPYFTQAHQKQICSTKDLFGIHFCPSASVLFRKQALQSFDFPDFRILAGDLLLKLLISLSGLIYRMYDVMSVYRITGHGATEYNNKHQKELILNRIVLFDYFNKVSEKKFNKYIRIETLLMESYVDYLNSKSYIRTAILKIYRKVLFLHRERVFNS